jgi:hypothetical protein
LRRRWGFWNRLGKMSLSKRCSLRLDSRIGHGTYLRFLYERNIWSIWWLIHGNKIPETCSLSFFSCTYSAQVIVMLLKNVLGSVFVRGTEMAVREDSF